MVIKIIRKIHLGIYHSSKKKDLNFNSNMKEGKELKNKNKRI
jgi:hypothetical protein